VARRRPAPTLRFEEDPDAAACEDPGAVCVYAATPRASARRSRGARRTGSCRGRARGGARRRRWSSTSRAAWTPRRAGRCSRCGTSCARRCTLSARWWQGAPRLRGNVGGGRCTATPLPFPRFRLFAPSSDPICSDLIGRPPQDSLLSCPPRLSQVRRASVAVLTRICMRPAACPCSGLSGLHVFRPRSQ
ncbi:unnamed protein product, partial [Prorocentrum cordatum]